MVYRLSSSRVCAAVTASKPPEIRCLPEVIYVEGRIGCMGRAISKHLAVAEELLEEVRSWSQEEVEALPRFYREAAERYRRLAKDGEP